MFIRALMSAIAAALIIASSAPAGTCTTDNSAPSVPTIVLPGEPKPIPLFVSQYWNNDDPWKRMEEERQYREKQENERQEQQRQYDQRQREYESQQRQQKMDQIDNEIRYGNPSSYQLEQYKRDMQDLEFKRNTSGAGRSYDPMPNYQESNERNKYDQLQQQINNKQQEVRQQEEANRHRTTPSYEYDDSSQRTSPSTSPATPARKPDTETQVSVGDVAVLTLTVKGLGTFTFRHTLVSTDTTETILGGIAKQVNATPQLTSRRFSATVKPGGNLVINVGDYRYAQSDVSVKLTTEPKPAASAPATTTTPPATTTPATAPQEPKAQEQQPSTSAPTKDADSEKASSKKAKKQKRTLAKKVFGGIGKIFRRHSDE